MDDHTLDFAFIEGQVDEFEKLAINLGVLNPAKWTQAGKGRAVGALAGSLLGAGAGAATAEEGQRGAGAVRGALAGGVLGTGVGQVGTAQGRRQVTRFGQRQAHSITGYTPGTYQKEKGILSAFGKGLSPEERLAALRRMKMDVPEAGDATRRIHGARTALKTLPKGAVEGSELGRMKLRDVEKGWVTGHLPERLQKGLANLKMRRDIAKLEQAESGATSLPGFVKGLVTDPKKAISTGAMAAGGTGVVLPLAFAAPDVVQGVREGDMERVGAGLAEGGAYALGGGLPMLGSMALGSGARALGGIPGKVYKRLAGKEEGSSPEQLPPQYAQYYGGR